MNRENLSKILAIERILYMYPNGITTQEIISRLESLYGIIAERKSIYTNIAVLTRFINICTYRKNNRTIYYIVNDEKG